MREDFPKGCFIAAICLFLLIVLFGGCALPFVESTQPASTWITAEKYAAIEMGMSTAQANRIFGRPGHEMSRSSIGEIDTVMYQWTNPGGGNVILMFQDDKLIQRSQFGLPSGGAR